MKTKRSPTPRSRKAIKRNRSTSKKKTASRKLPRFDKSIGGSASVTCIGTILTALQQSGGVTVADLSGLTGWQAHSVRAALCRLRQAGHRIGSSRDDGQYRYRIEGNA